MIPTQFLLAYAVSVPVFFAIDMLWLGVIATSFYRSQLGHLMGDINWPIAFLFYFVFLAGLIFFAVMPALEARSIMTAIIYGALFGFFTYATYDLTNWATLKDWPAFLSIVDMVWGTVLSASVATGTYWILTTFILK